MEIVCEAGENLVLVRCSRAEIKEQEINARVQPPEMLERLQATIANEKRLESVPFGVIRDGAIELISGHHRMRAATMANLPEFLVLADTRELTREQIVAKQLAHNSIQGRDDESMLDRLLSEIKTLDLQLEAFVPPKAELGSVKLEINEGAIEFRSAVVALVFMPEQKRSIDKTFESIMKRIPKGADEVWMIPAGLAETLAASMSKLSRKEAIRSVSAIMVRMCEIVDQALAADVEAA